LAAVAVFILIIACINFINLSTASQHRPKEVPSEKTVAPDRPTSSIIFDRVRLFSFPFFYPGSLAWLLLLTLTWFVKSLQAMIRMKTATAPNNIQTGCHHG